MKKIVLGCALLAIGGYAAAQSSVTLYGIADAGVGSSHIDGDKGVEMLANSTMNNVTSRVGVRGEEDLGSGLKAGFTFESGLNLKNGKAGGVDGSDQTTKFWSRGANVYLSSATFGKLQFGKDWTPADYALGQWDLTDLANYSMVENMFMDAGTPFIYNSGFQYTTPEFAGFHAMGTFVTHADNDGHPKFDVAGFYDGDKLNVGVDFNKVKTRKANWSVGAKYQVLPWLAAAASYTDVRSFDWGDGTNGGKRRGMTLAARVSWDLWSLTADLGRDFRRAGGNSAQGLGGPKKFKKYTNGLLEAKYALSKRTFLYGAYLRMDGTNNYGLGMQHQF